MLMAGLNASVPESIIASPLIGPHCFNFPEYPANQERGISHRIHKAGLGLDFPSTTHPMSVDFISSNPIVIHVLD